MSRDAVLVGAAIVFLGLVSGGVPGAAAAEVRSHRAHAARVTAIHAEGPRQVAVRRRVAKVLITASVAAARPPSGVSAYQIPAPVIDTSVGSPLSLAYQALTSATGASSTSTALSAQELEASRMAGTRGDHDFLMVDKALGKVILFQNDQPVFAGPALTGQSTNDALAPGELTEKFDNLYALDTKVTPAGRFTVQRGYDKELGGPLLEVSEIRGKDWGIAIHQVYLGTPSEHRDIRINSPSSQDKHISFGCINVTPAAIQYLLREIPEDRPFPLYILPEDASQTAAYFAPRTS